MKGRLHRHTVIYARQRVEALSGNERIVRLLLDLLREIEGDAGFANPIQIVISPDEALF